ncbi:MAG: hypothetical protein ACPGRZ_12035 [Alphaproteobacteria bacterium]
MNGTEFRDESNGSGTSLFTLPGPGRDHTRCRFGEPLRRDDATTVLVDPHGSGKSLKESPWTVT